MESQYLRTLCSVMETGSFSKAAQELNITQSAVSQRIKFLEDYYGVPLIERSGSALTLSEAGIIVTNKAKQILQLEKELEEKLKNLGKKTRLSLSCTPTFGIVYLPKVLNHFFMANTSDVDFKFMINSPALTLQGVHEGSFDLAIMEHFGELDVRDNITIRLPEDELVFIASPALRLSGGEVTLDELTKHRLIARRDGCSSRNLLQENLAKTGNSLDDFNGTIIYDDLYLTIQTVLAGRGVAFVSRSLVAEHLKRGELLEHSIAGFSCQRLRTMVLLKQRKDDPFINNFVNCVFSAFETPQNRDMFKQYC